MLKNFKREIWIGLTGDGCGAADINFFETKQKAEIFIEENNDGLADICIEKLTISSDSAIHIVGTRKII